MSRDKYGNIYVVCLHEALHVPGKRDYKDRITRSAQAWIDHYHVDAAFRFSNRPRECASGVFQALSGTSLNGCTANDKLALFGHGSTEKIGPYGPAKLAAALSSWGLKAAYLITFKACNIGIRDQYLLSFLQGCKDNEIQVGWLKAYKGLSSTVLDRDDKPHEHVEKKVPGYGNLMLSRDEERASILKGN